MVVFGLSKMLLSSLRTSMQDHYGIIQKIMSTTSVINFQWNAQNSDFGHVRTYSSLHKLRNTQRKIHGTYLGNIYGIYKECRGAGVGVGRIYCLNVFHIFPLCFLIYGVKSRSGHDRSQSFGTIWHVSGPEIIF